jgi:hypothetical protein
MQCGSLGPGHATLVRASSRRITPSLSVVRQAVSWSRASEQATSSSAKSASTTCCSAWTSAALTPGHVRLASRPTRRLERQAPTCLPAQPRRAPSAALACGAGRAASRRLHPGIDRWARKVASGRADGRWECCSLLPPEAPDGAMAAAAQAKRASLTPRGPHTTHQRAQRSGKRSASSGGRQGRRTTAKACRGRPTSTTGSRLPAHRPRGRCAPCRAGGWGLMHVLSTLFRDEAHRLTRFAPLPSFGA